MVSKRWLRRTDFVLIGAVAAILIISLITIGSATHINNPSDERYWYVERQGIFTIMNVAVAIFLMNFDYHSRFSDSMQAISSSFPSHRTLYTNLTPAEPALTPSLCPLVYDTGVRG